MTLCSTPESLRAALETLSGHSHVFLDCEGHTLGDIGGKLSLLNLGVVVDKDGNRRLSIFLIDTLAFEGPNLRHLIPVFDIMRSQVVFKVVFDGRMDASELLHGHGVQLRNVLDLQVADIIHREKRGESANERLGRLIGFLPQHELTRNGVLYSQVQKLNGLESAMQEHGVPSDGKGRVDHSKWLQRPLQPSALQYAAEDIHKICLLYEKFAKKGYISQDELVRQSASYIALHAKGRPNGSDKYNRHGLLPLALLTEAGAVPIVQCRGCRRNLPMSAFPQPNLALRSNVACFVCLAVDAKAASGGNTRFRTYEDFDEGLEDAWETYEDPDFDEGLEDAWETYEDPDFDEGLDDVWDESFYDDY